MPITEYKCDYTCSRPGLRYGVGSDNNNDITGVHKEASNLLPGIAMVQGPDSEAHDALPSAAAELFAGILAYDPTCVAECDDPGIPPNRAHRLLRKGLVIVQLEDGLTPAKGDPVYVRVAAGTGLVDGVSVIGAIRNDDDTATALLLEGARFFQAGDASENWAVVDIDNATVLA